MQSKVEEEWWVPNDKQHHYCVVSNMPTGHDKKSDLQEYGGHLICESVFDPRIRAKIVALPKLLAAIHDVLKPYEQDTAVNMANPALGALRDVYNEAMGLKTLTKEHEDAPSEQSDPDGSVKRGQQTLVEEPNKDPII